jgi:hypothetical protein
LIAQNQYSLDIFSHQPSARTAHRSATSSYSAFPFHLQLFSFNPTWHLVRILQVRLAEPGS